MTSTYESFDKANIDRCKHILSLSNEEIIKLMYDATEICQGGKKIKDAYEYVEKTVKPLCKFFVNNPDPKNPKIGIKKQIYKYPASYKGNKGRLFVRSIGLQGLQNNIRAFLCQGIYKDFDIVNSAPTIIYNTIKQKFPDMEFPFLRKYINDRGYFLKQTNCSKTDIIIRFFSDKLALINNNNTLLKNFDIEVKQIQKLIWDLNEYPELKDTTKKNKMGSYLSKVYHIKENIILQKSKGKLQLGVPMFDGALIELEGDTSVEDILDILNENGKEFGVEFINKDLKTDIVIDQDLVDSYNEDSKSYQKVKEEFEKNHFFVKHPPTYVEILKNKSGIEQFFPYKKQDFMHLVEHIQYEDFDYTGNLVEKSFFPKWAKDAEKRMYDKVDFIPNIEQPDDSIYNSFQGFRITKLASLENDFVPNQEAVDIYLEHLKVLVDYEEDAFNYVVNYFAHLYQKPDEIPLVALLFKSPEGIGKDTMMDFHSAILGKEFLFRTKNIKLVLGDFNDQIQKKMIITINEVCGLDGFKFKEDLKNLITADTLNINPKGKTSFDIQNFARVILFTNNNNVLDIKHDDRRYCVFYTEQKKEKAYFTERLRPLLKDDNALRSIYNFFVSHKIPEDFNFETSRPITKAYKDMLSSNISPVFTYLYETFKTDDYKETFEDDIKVHKKTGKVGIQTTPLFRNLKWWLELNGISYKTDFKKLKSLLLSLGVNKMDLKVNGTPRSFYAFDIPDLLKKLKERGVQDINKDMEDDEWE